MLVLTQRIGEAVLIGGKIEVRILAIEGDQVRVGFTAPKEVNIIREHLREKLIKAGVAVRADK